MAGDINQAISVLVQEMLNSSFFRTSASRDALIAGVPSAELLMRDQDNAFNDLSQIVKTCVLMGRQENEFVINTVYRNAARILPEKTDMAGKVKKCFDDLLGAMGAKSQPAAVAPPEYEIDIPFVNRKAELMEVLSHPIPPYYLIDGPAGYGKTRVLYALKERFIKQGCSCGYASAKGCETFVDLIRRLSSDLNITSSIDWEAFDAKVKSIPEPERKDENAFSKIAVDLGWALAKAIMEKYFPGPSSDYQGVVFLLDDIGTDNLPLEQEVTLLNSLIDAVKRNLGSVTPFKERRGAFRIIVSGNYISSQGKITHALPFGSIILHPFDLQVVLQTVLNVLNGFSPEDQQQISAHLMYLTGGHPGCIVSILDEYKKVKGNADDFVRYQEDSIWNDIVSPVVNDVRKSIPSHLIDIFHRLSIYRAFDEEILEELINKKIVDYEEDAYALGDDLTATYLYGREKFIIRDAITRCLIVLHLQHTWPKEEFAKRCMEAHQIYKARLSDRQNSRDREIWAKECLYQALQAHIHEISSKEKREALAKDFMENTVPDTLKNYLEGIGDPKRANNALRALGDDLGDDWEFIFVLNYFLREEEYNEKPYNLLIEKLASGKTS